MNTAAAVITAFVAAFAVTALLGFVMIPWLRRLEFGQTVTDMKRHSGRQSTPSMGGVTFIIGTVSAILLTVLTDKLMGGEFICPEAEPTPEGYVKSGLSLWPWQAGCQSSHFGELFRGSGRTGGGL